MPFINNFNGLRAKGRELVLPAKRIQDHMDLKLFYRKGIKSVTDFGAGTLYWTDYLLTRIPADKVFPVDVVFGDGEIRTTPQNARVACRSGLDGIEAGPDALFFACDTLHHLGWEEWEHILHRYLPRYGHIVIKDIDCRHRFGNFMNRMHDKLINHESVRNVNPEYIAEELEEMGYECSCAYMPRLWYPHFLLAASRKRPT